ncbi:MAG TPA: Imm1 family immunity protein [Pseudonocardiaceae bacterium]
MSDSTLLVSLRCYPHGYPVSAQARSDVFAVTETDIEDLVARVARLESDDAYLEHQGRPRYIDPDDGEEAGDHVMYLTVAGRWAYLRYIGPIVGAAEISGIPVVPLGDPISPETHGTNNIDYVAGSGVSLRAAEQALQEFLATGELPRNIRWVLEADLEAGPIHVLKRGA